MRSRQIKGVDLAQAGDLIQNMAIEKGDHISPFEVAFPQKAVVKVVAIDVGNRAQKASPEMTKPPEGGLSPQEHPAC